MAEALTSIEPSTDGTITVTVQVAGTLQDDATVVANVYTPRGAKVADAVAFTPVGSGSGEYTLAWDATWTESSGRGVEGEYLLEVVSTRVGVKRTRRFRQPVQYTDTE